MKKIISLLSSSLTLGLFLLFFSVIPTFAADQTTGTVSRSGNDLLINIQQVGQSAIDAANQINPTCNFTQYQIRMTFGSEPNGEYAYGTTKFPLTSAGTNTVPNFFTSSTETQLYVRLTLYNAIGNCAADVQVSDWIQLADLPVNFTYTTLAPTPTPTPSIIDNPPDITMPSDKTIYEQDTYQGSGTFDDPDSTSWSATVDYGDGTGVQPLALNGNTFTLNHQYTSYGGYTITVSITDDAGLTGENSLTVSVFPRTVSDPTTGTITQDGTNIYRVAITHIGLDTLNEATKAYQQIYGTTCDNWNNYTIGYTSSDTPNITTVYEGVGGTFPSDSPVVPLSSGTGWSFYYSPSDQEQYPYLGVLIDLGSDTGGCDLQIEVSPLFNISTLPQNYSYPIPASSTVTLTPIADSFLNYYEKNQNEGANPALRIQQSLKSRSLLKFDESQIAEAVGNDPNFTVTLQFTITANGNNWGTAGRQIELDRLLQNWAEGNGYVNGNPSPNHGTGSGVTWNCAIDTDISNNTKDCTAANTWDMNDPGSYPFNATPSATAIITNNETGTVSFDVTQDIKNFLSGTNQNYGWLLKKTDETVTGKVDFGSKDSGNSPVLIITPN